MKKLLPLLFCCCLNFSSICAEESTIPTEFFADEAQVSIDDPEQYTAQMRVLSSLSNTTERGIAGYYYRIKEIDVENGTVTLENHSRLDIGWWYKDLILDWQVGDRLTICRDRFWVGIGNGFGIQNLDKGSLAWATFGDWPRTDNSDYIVEATFEHKPGYVPTYAIITLKSGFKFRVQAFYLGVNNVNVTVFVYQTENSYAIGLSTGRLIRNAQLWESGNPDWMHEAQ